MLHVEAPAAGKYDTSKTYHLPMTNLKTKEYHFTSVKDKLRVNTLELCDLEITKFLLGDEKPDWDKMSQMVFRLIS